MACLGESPTAGSSCTAAAVRAATEADRQLRESRRVNGKGEEESEWREQGSQGHLPEHSKEELAAMQAGRAPRDLQRLVHGRHCSSISNFQFTSNIPLKPILRASVTPKPRRVSKNSINKYELQLLLKLQSLIRPG